MPDKELTLEDLEADIKKLLNKEVFEKLQGKWSIYKLKCRGFGFRVFITLVEEEDPRTISWTVNRSIAGPKSP